MKRLVLPFLLALAPVAWAGPEDTHRLTLDEALRRAESSPTARAIALGIERARAEVRAAGLWPNPEVSVSREESGGNIEQFRNLSVSIPLGGRLAAEKSAARSGVAGAEASAKQERMVLRGRVRDAFLDLLLAQERQAALESGSAQLAELVRVLREREREGASSGFDRMRAEWERAEIETDLLAARARLARARAVLAALVTLPSSGLLAVGSLEAGSSLPGLAEIRMLASARGDVVALQAEAERADRLARASRRRALPDLTLTGGTKTTEEGGADDTGPVVGLGFSLPVFDRGQGGFAAARAEAALLRARRDALVREADAEIESAYEEALALRESEKTYSAIGNPEELARIARAAYEGGEMRILELLDAYRIALAARLKMMDLHAEARRAEIGLDRVAGAEVAR